MPKFVKQKKNHLRTSRSSTSPTEPTATFSRAPTLCLRRRTRPLHLPRGPRGLVRPTHLRHSQKWRHRRGQQDSIAPAELDCDICKLKAQCCPNALCPQDPAWDLHEETPATRLVRTPRPRIRGGPSPSEESRDAVRTSSGGFCALTRLRLRGPNGSQRRISSARYCPKPETTCSLKTDEHASGNAGRITPARAAEEPPKEPFQPLPETA